MSYILDALKRADAERVRGQVPGLHAQPLSESGADERGNASPRWALWGGMAVGVVVVAALAWRMGADANAPVPAPLAAPPAPTPAPEPLAQAAQPTPAPVPAVAAPVIPSYAPVPEAATTRPPVKDSRPAAAPAPAQPAAPTQTPTPVPAAAPANARVPLLSELPASLRQQLPPLMVSGSVYSDDAASRFIMLNGDVVKEGAQPAPGLVVERIEPKSAVLRYKGERFRLPF